jgi:hypothetical protein
MPETRDLICVFALLSFPAFAQVERANLSGTVTDPSGAVVSRATIDVFFEGTGFKRTVESGDAGTYAISALPIGHCRVTVQEKGFQTQQVDDLVLTVAENRTLDFKLSISAAAETVQVTASAVELEQTTAETGGWSLRSR